MIVPDEIKARLEALEKEFTELKKRHDELHDAVHLIRSDLATVKLGTIVSSGQGK